MYFIRRGDAMTESTMQIGQNLRRRLGSLRVRSLNLKFFLLFIPVAYVTYLSHELGHWSVGELLGNRMVCSNHYAYILTVSTACQLLVIGTYGIALFR